MKNLRDVGKEPPRSKVDPPRWSEVVINKLVYNNALGESAACYPTRRESSILDGSLQYCAGAFDIGQQPCLGEIFLFRGNMFVNSNLIFVNINLIFVSSLGGKTHPKRNEKLRDVGKEQSTS